LWVVIINKVLTRFWVLVFGRFVPDPRSSALVFGRFLDVLILVFGFSSGRPRSGRQWLVLAASRELSLRLVRHVHTLSRGLKRANY
jgi:hypothetical protein